MSPPDLDAVMAAVVACPSVAGMAGGPFGEVATYLPGRRLPGVRLAADELEIHVVARWGPSLPDVADAVRQAVVPLAGGWPVTVYIDDIEVPDAGVEAPVAVPGRATP